MKITFSTKITPQSLQEHAVKIGWDDCSDLTDGEFVYETASKSACLAVHQNGTGVYNGQRSLLFSHSIFSRLTTAWLADELSILRIDSQDADIPAFIYFGECYMRDLRNDALHKILAPKGMDNYYRWVIRVFAARDEITDISICENTTEVVSNTITKGLKRSYRSWFRITQPHEDIK